MSESVGARRRTRRTASQRRTVPESQEVEVPVERAELAERILALLRAEAATDDLEREIEALRQVLGEVLLAEPDPRRLVSHVARLIDVEVRALRAQRLLAGRKADDLAGALTQLLVELGLGEGEGGR
ncbi:hypothetical protein NET03_04875 [Thermomicrobium sp. CFH 73360]|uniref:hypothetical protein n=1 Tax=Thermomicrobium sp. CFH 73360 TaxID=2951987 RepID=UPI00207739C0|nr:hypothetical protein [Thermomicrobium sp. CFH 73360]MCM8745856.1 hypothetical protein [Thermomicrobium sp. CFH 73360]